MQVHRDINHLPFFNNAAITIGTFDGVHSGHLQIIHQLNKEARKTSGQSVIITFDPHPRMVLNPQKNQLPIQLLTTLPEKIELLSRMEIDHLVIVPFTLAFSQQSAGEYIADFLVSKFHPKTIIIGYDHRFGKDRSGDYKLLERYQDSFDYVVKEIPEQVLHDVSISSTKIREALQQGDIDTANQCLGYDYFFEGKVIDGNKIGRTLGYPTANLEISNPAKLIPADGIYAVHANLVNTDTTFPDVSTRPINYEGMMSIGIRPTIGDHKKMIEVNLFDFDQNIYGRTLKVQIRKYLRPEIKFNNLEELKQQIAKDQVVAEKIFRNSQ